jgi:hypothetical protein
MRDFYEKLGDQLEQMAREDQARRAARRRHVRRAAAIAVVLLIVLVAIGVALAPPAGVR